jgi:hypothetical protein
VRRAALAFALAGCTPLAPYSPQADGPGAELRVVAFTLGGMAVAVARDEPGCEGGAERLIARFEERQPHDVRAIYRPDGSLTPAPSAEARVAANRPFTLLVQAQGLLDGWYGYGCARAVTFTPEPGGRYLALYVSEDPYRCRIDVWRVEPGHRETPPDLERHAPQCALRAYRDSE